MPEYVKVASRDSLPPGAKLMTEIGERSILVFNVEGSFYAIDDICTHDGGPLGEGDFEGVEIQCPRHGARFDVRTGRALCLPAFEPVATHRVEVRGDDVFVALDE
jgi:3-phenylpropionate/trans-cinnamate dioxygenase ferredoxin component